MHIYTQLYFFMWFISLDVSRIDDVLPVGPEKNLGIKNIFQLGEIVLAHIFFSLLIQYKNHFAFGIKENNVFQLQHHIRKPFSYDQPFLLPGKGFKESIFRSKMFFKAL